MAIYDTGTASLASNGRVTGVGTQWAMPLTLIRVGATILFKTEPVQIYTISEITSDTSMAVYNPNGETVPDGTGYAILAHDGISVQGLAQDVAETLRYYQSRETEVADAIDAFNNFDHADFESKVTQVNTQHGDVVSIGTQVSTDAAQVSADKDAAALSASSASSDKDAAAASAQEAADYAASLDTSNLLRKDLNFSDVADKGVARGNLDVYSKLESDRKAPAISVKSFGAIGDGLDHPLSEIFSTLIEAQAKYPFVTSLDQTQDYAGIQSAINAAKQINSSVFIPSGSYVINKTITIDYAASIYGEGGQGLRDINVNVHEPSPVRGTVINSKVAPGHCISISPPAYCFGLTLRDFAIWGVDGQCDKGIYLHNMGWMGIISGINVQKFPNQGIEIGYIQDTYFNNCSVVGCGNQYNYAVTCLTDSNYVYFNGCHFELSAYLLKLNSCWNFSWNQCHFEVARPVGAGVTDDDRYYYVSACVDLGSAYRLQFSNNTFIPVDAGYLSSKIGLDRGSIPYFMTGTGSYVSFTNDIWLAPEGSVDVGYFSGSQIDMKGCKFIGLSPSRPALYIENGLVSNCSFVPKVDDDQLRLFVARVNNGSFIGNNIGFTFDSQQSTKRTSGFLLIGSATCSGNHFPSDNIVFKYLDNAATVTGFDGGKTRFVVLPAGGDIDLTNYHPATNFRIDANSVVISNIYGAPYGRDLLITTNGTGTVINYSSDSVITQGAVNFQLPQYRTSFLKSIDAGGSSLLFQIA